MICHMGVTFFAVVVVGSSCIHPVCYCVVYDCCFGCNDSTVGWSVYLFSLPSLWDTPHLRSYLSKIKIKVRKR